jgi:hypothetical protein
MTSGDAPVRLPSKSPLPGGDEQFSQQTFIVIRDDLASRITRV